jgi:autotransporter translocation and assembly factor TamB
MKYILKYLFISFFLLMGIILFLAITTEKGFLLELRYLSQYAPGKISIKHVSGTLPDFSLQDISYDYLGNHFIVQSVDVTWHPVQLLTGKLNFKKLAIKNASIQLAPSPSTSTSLDVNSLSQWFKLFRFIRVQSLILDNITVKQENQLIYLQGRLDEHWNFNWALKGFNITGKGNITGPK